MNHEPECEFEGERDPAFICNTCEDLQSAYKRGRLDAAMSVWQSANLHTCNGEIFLDLEIAYMRAKGKI